MNKGVSPDSCHSREEFLRALIDCDESCILNMLDMIISNSEEYRQVVLKNPEEYIQFLQKSRQQETTQELLLLIDVFKSAARSQFRGPIFQRLLAVFEREMQEFGNWQYLRAFCGLLVFCRQEISRNCWFIKQYWRLFLKEVEYDDDIKDALRMLDDAKKEVGDSMISPLFTLLPSFDSFVWKRKRFLEPDCLPSLASTVYMPGTDSLRELSREDRLLHDAIFGVRYLFSPKVDLDKQPWVLDSFICDDRIPYRECKLFLLIRSRLMFLSTDGSELIRFGDCLVARAIVDLLNRDESFYEEEIARTVEMFSLQRHLDASLRSSLAKNDRFQMVTREFYLVPE